MSQTILTEKTARDPSLDFVKGVAIFLVIFGHCIQAGSGEAFFAQQAYFSDPVFQMIYSLHMPLFIAISGYLFWFSVCRHGFGKSIADRFRSFAPVCLTWALLSWLFNFAKGDPVGLSNVVSYLFSDLWFLWSVLFSACCVAAAEKLFQSHFGAIGCAAFYIFLFVLFLLTPDMWILDLQRSAVLYFNPCKFMVPFFMAGFYYAKFQQKWVNREAVGAVCLAFWCALLPLYSQDSFVYTTGVTVRGKDSVFDQLYLDFYRCLIGAVGVIFVLFLLKKLYLWLDASKHSALQTPPRKFVLYLGQNSLAYYVLSTFLVGKLLPVCTRQFHLNYLCTLLEALLVLFICELINRLVKRSHFLSRLLIGK